uniref:Uncharacterized protein n=1 Tax=Arundo donax TaxID=35708 RepID=A0A0A9EY95_ARUDO
MLMLYQPSLFLDSGHCSYIFVCSLNKMYGCGIVNCMCLSLSSYKYFGSPRAGFQRSVVDIVCTRGPKSEVAVA